MNIHADDIEITLIETLLDYLNGVLSNNDLVRVLNKQLNTDIVRKNSKVTVLRVKFNQLNKLLAQNPYPKDTIRELVEDILEELSSKN